MTDHCTSRGITLSGKIIAHLEKHYSTQHYQENNKINNFHFGIMFRLLSKCVIVVSHSVNRYCISIHFKIKKSKIKLFS